MKTNTIRYQQTRVFALILGFVLLGGQMLAQETVNGTVTDANTGEPLIGVNVLIEGTTIGTASDADGNYELNLAGVETESPVILASYVGYHDFREPIAGRSVVDIALQADVEMLEDVVVTALGVERETRSLGYAAQQIDAQPLADSPESNFVNALAGRLAGVNVTGATSGPAASSRVVIRGETSLSGNNQPLFVVDGIPITNGLSSASVGPPDTRGSAAVDFGNAASLINTYDIESINVLKGPTAAALYGSRASNGVILVTTKTGGATQGLGVTVNVRTTGNTILRLPDFQNEYGFGNSGKFDYESGTFYTSDRFDAFGENWGPPMDGRLIRQWNSDGEPVPFTPAPDNVRNFFRTGLSQTYNVSIVNGTENGDFRASYTLFDQLGIVPNTSFQRNTFNASVGRQITDRLSVRANANYYLSDTPNVPSSGYDESSSIMYNWLWYPRQVEIDDLADYWVPGQEDIQQQNFEKLWTNNPWFVVNENTNAMDGRRFIGNATVSYELTNKLRLRLRAGGDVEDQSREFRRAFSTKGALNGAYRVDDLYFKETNYEALLTYDEYAGGRLFNVEVSVGGNRMRQEWETVSTQAPAESGLSEPGLFTLENARGTVVTDQFQAEKRINSVFGLATFSLRDMVYLDITGRNDWSSTLPADANSFFYPSASLSLILSEMIGLPRVISFAKLRLGAAEVGGDTDPYQIRNIFRFQNAWGGLPVALESAQVANADLKPESVSTYEIGTDLRFFGNSLLLDASVYEISSKDQILNVPLARSTGYVSRVLNAGEIRNRGFEVALTLQPFQFNSQKSWEGTVNFGRNRSEVVELAEGITTFQIVPDLYPGDDGRDLSFEAIEGEPYGQLVGLGFERVDDSSSQFHGEIVHENGLPVLTTNKVSVGTYQPDFTYGFGNTFRYKDLSLYVLFSGQVGGKIYSRNHAMMNTGGTITNNNDPNLDLTTLDGRPVVEPLEYIQQDDGTWLPARDPDGSYAWVTVDEGGVVGPGVRLDETGDYVPNDVKVSTRAYFYAYYGNGFDRDNIEAATYDATFMKLREVRLTYDLPSTLMQSLGIHGAALSLVGRNLLLFTDVPSIDPETYSIRGGVYVPGFESTQIPPTRNISLNVNLRF